MQIKDMPLEEQRKYNAKAQQRVRDRAKAKALAAVIPKAGKYRMPEAQRKKLAAHAAQIMTPVEAELTRLTEQDRFVIESIADVSMGLENGYFQEVFEPSGILVGGHFPDAAASEAIEHVHRKPQILESKIFSDLYKKFVTAVSKWVQQNPAHASPEFASDIRQELDGTYELPKPKLKPTPERLPEPQPPPPSIERMGTKLGEQLNGDYSQFLGSRPDITPEAQQYLDHGKLNRNRI